MSFDNLPDQTPAPQESISTVSNEVGFEVPVERISLPSRGCLYPPDHAFSNEEYVDIKCMTAKEEDILTSRALLKSGKIFSSLIKSCVLNKTLDPDQLLIGDRDALLVAIRVTGYGSEYQEQVSCQSCYEDFVAEFNLSKLEIQRLGAEPLQVGVNAFSFQLPMSKQNVVFKLLTGADEDAIDREREVIKKRLGAAAHNPVTTRLAHSILSIGQVSDRSKLKYMIQNLPARDSRALRTHINKITPSINMIQEVRCPHCSEVSDVDVPFGKNFFWPG